MSSSATSPPFFSTLFPPPLPAARWLRVVGGLSEEVRESGTGCSFSGAGIITTVWTESAGSGAAAGPAGQQAYTFLLPANGLICAAVQEMGTADPQQAARSETVSFHSFSFPLQLAATVFTPHQEKDMTRLLGGVSAVPYRSVGQRSQSKSPGQSIANQRLCSAHGRSGSR